ncbi:CoxG family protein [Curvivirga aplysinae]|uniref:CoxG family protein n=1 Tax=Curvivirga aplysinae TaxID=2529852 RepID=UPI0012BBAA0D|nr:carbon monoxide dehydrogenase subunit G [Curvivirga aplysinae]MTI08308.1 carbon monoxide dehydrogenase [Curvivirga aplysinae]
MEMNGEYLLKASREDVWAALNDAEVLKTCIPGCEELNKESDTKFNAIAVQKIGPVKAKFKGEVELENLNPPESYRIVGAGNGGIAGFAKGSASVVLEEAEEGTLLKYEVDASIGGKLAQLGQRLVKSTSAKLADKFFDAFAAQFSDDEEGEEVA